MDVEILENRDEFACISYILGDIMIDAGVMPPRAVKKLILTHCHYDHVMYASQIKKKYGTEIYASEKCAYNLKRGGRITSPFSEKDFSDLEIDFILKEGDQIDGLTVLQTPGHTDGSICLLQKEKKILFTGDTMFHDGYGRTDLPTGDENELFKSLKRIGYLKKEINSLQIYPGHWKHLSSLSYTYPPLF